MIYYMIYYINIYILLVTSTLPIFKVVVDLAKHGLYSQGPI